METLTEYLKQSAVSRETIDTFIDPNEISWGRFDPVVGYTLGNSMPRDGIDGSSTLSTAQPSGIRTPRMYTERPCRINTYGNSFTQCHQVSDGETWQEYLAAHLGEPIRNFGMGGFGVYQAYRRLLRAEDSDLGARYVILYIWGDDHCRSVMRCRHAVTYPRWKGRRGLMFHGNFWAHVEMDLDSGTLVEKDNPLSSPESLYKMTDPDFMVHALKDDLMLQLYVAGSLDPSTLDLTALQSLAEILGVQGVDISSTETTTQSSHRLRTAYGFAATKHIVRKASAFCRKNGKQLMVCILCPTATRQLLHGQARYDHDIANHLEREVSPFFDMNIAHQHDYQAFNLSVDEYLKRYFIGHYSPAGNHFFAHSIKDPIVDWLDPSPITYRNDGRTAIDFVGYLAE